MASPFSRYASGDSIFGNYHLEVSLNYCSQNGGNLYRAPYYNRNLNIGPRIASNFGSYHLVNLKPSLTETTALGQASAARAEQWLFRAVAVGSFGSLGGVQGPTASISSDTDTSNNDLER